MEKLAFSSDFQTQLEGLAPAYGSLRVYIVHQCLARLPVAVAWLPQALPTVDGSRQRPLWKRIHGQGAARGCRAVSWARHPTRPSAAAGGARGPSWRGGAARAPPRGATSGTAEAWGGPRDLPAAAVAQLSLDPQSGLCSGRQRHPVQLRRGALALQHGSSGTPASGHRGDPVLNVPLCRRVSGNGPPAARDPELRGCAPGPALAAAPLLGRDAIICRCTGAGAPMDSGCCVCLCV
eukprot:s755_g28.t1